MVKTTMATKLPRKLEQKMQIVGEQIRLARLRRNLSVAQVADRATCSPVTINRITKLFSFALKMLLIWPHFSTMPVIFILLFC